MPTPAATHTAPVVLEPRGGGLSRLLWLVAAAVAAGLTALAWFEGYDDPVLLAVGAVVTVAFVVRWATASPQTEVSIADGVVDVRVADAHHTFDLTKPQTEVEVRGEPGRRGWAVLFHRRSLPPFEVDASMVDPVAFTEALRHWRPEV